MNGLIALLIAVLSDGAIFGFAAIGVAIIVGWGRFADLTPDAAFTGGAVGLWCAVTHGIDAAIGPMFGFTFGACAGLATASIVLIGIPPLLASLVIVGFGYTVNWIVLGRPLQTLSNEQSLLAGYEPQVQLAVLAAALISFATVIWLLAVSGFGLRLRAVSENPNSVPGSRVRWQATIIWLALGNGMVGMSGAMFAAKSFIIEINMGAGTLISGLSAFLLGWAIMRFRERVPIVLAAAVLGALVLRAVLTIALSAGAPGEFFRAITAGALLCCMVIASRASRNLLSGLRL